MYHVLCSHWSVEGHWLLPHFAFVYIGAYICCASDVHVSVQVPAFSSLAIEVGVPLLNQVWKRQKVMEAWN